MEAWGYQELPGINHHASEVPIGAPPPAGVPLRGEVRRLAEPGPIVSNFGTQKSRF